MSDPPTRARILDAAVDHLVRHQGALEMQAVARAAGVVPSVVSHHYGSRSGLLVAVVDGFFDAFHAQVLDADLRAVGSWPTRERERIRRGVAFHFDEPLAAVVYGSLARDPQVAAAESRCIAQVIAESARNIAAAQRAGELEPGVDSTLAAASIFGASRQITLVALAADPRPTRAAVAAQLWRVTAAAVTARPIIPDPQEEQHP